MFLFCHLCESFVSIEDVRGNEEQQVSFLDAVTLNFEDRSDEREVAEYGYFVFDGGFVVTDESAEYECGAVGHFDAGG